MMFNRFQFTIFCRVNEGFITDVETTVTEERMASRRSRIDAGRRVYKFLLLNAWRRCRTEVATLGESLKQVKAQNSQLQMQADVLQKLRESECKRRDQAVTENGALKEEILALMKTNNLLLEDKKCLDERICRSEEEKMSLKADILNVQSNLLNLKAEMKCMEETLQNERFKITSLKEELHVLREKIALSEKDASVNQEITKKLKEAIVILENKLLEERQCAIKQDAILATLKRQCIQDKEENEKLHDTIEILLSEKIELENEVEKNAEKFNEFEEDKDKLEDQIQILMMQIETLKVSLRNERNKPWWITTRDMFRYPFALLKIAAVTMLPALPQLPNDDSENNSRME
ncbi:sporulation-specific protein 15-like isoform X2 [Agrilus planipennis]|uniref:Sporulation-specific protein 15-like isoform X2 n=1 Tax=Agrilus planipennis TaxID=224129 RepID=A0A7F5R6G5_AGRPL|nr:sporulation-specific protein 15-like isoform X2 [Agrilus planipennis]